MNLPLVLLHGWGLTPQVWAPLRAQLSAARDVATPPLPGHADAAPAADRNLDAWCAALLPHLPERCVLCGWSLGAQLALALAQRHPERVARLVLIGASPRFVAQDDWGHGLEAATVDNFVRGFASDPGATLRRFVALQALGDARRRAVQGALNAALPAADAMQHAALSSGLHLLADTDLRATIARLPHPTLLVRLHSTEVAAGGKRKPLRPGGGVTSGSTQTPHNMLN